MKKLVIIFAALMLIGVATVWALDYAESYTSYGESCARIKNGNTPLPDGSVYPVEQTLKIVPSQYLIIDNGVLREKTVQEKAAYDTAVSNATAQAVVDWKNSKTNYNDIIAWDNRFMMRLTQANGILMSEGIITNAITPQTLVDSELATYMIQATNPAASSVGIALDECGKWVTSITINNIGSPPDGKPVEYYIEQH